VLVLSRFLKILAIFEDVEDRCGCINFAIFDQYLAICGKRYKIGPELIGSHIALSNRDISDELE